MEDKRGQQNDQKKDKSRLAAKPPLDSAKNASPIVESIPEFRSIALQNFPAAASLTGFVNLQSQLGWSSATEPASVEKLGLKLEDFVFKKNTTQPEKNLKNYVSDQPMHSLSFPRETIVVADPKPEPDFKPVSIKNSWANPQLRPIPNYYPMERSSRILYDHEHTLQDITGNLSECFRILGIQAKYFESPAGAALLTPDQVEMYIYLWKVGGGKQVCVELQRRRGDSVTFHRYARHILESASADFDPAEYKDYSDSHYLKSAEKLLRTELTKAHDQRQEARMAIELAAGLIKKDRLDARILGMQSLCILTDPRKTNLNTSLLASRAVLFGEGEPMFRHIHEFVLNVVQKRCMGDEDSLLEDMIVEYDSDDDEYFDDDEQRDESKPPEYHDSIKTMLNYGLTILANSWELLSTFESFDSEPENTDGNRISVDLAVARFHRMALDFTHTDILTSLLIELGRAEFQAHNACLAAKCLRILCQSSPDARERTKTLSGLEQAFRAEQVGKATNARLERECAALLRVLQD